MSEHRHSLAPDDDVWELFPAEGEMAALIREKDWTQTPLGHPRSWPNSLLTAINILLGSRYPMEIWWGPQYLRFYNDAYRPLLGPHRHPQYLGRPGQECWAELWDEIGPMLDGVMQTGIPTYADDALLVMTRKGFAEETYVSWSYGPIRNHDGSVGGIFCACDETTKKVLGRRRLALLHELSASAGSDAISKSFHILSKNAADIPFAIVYRCDDCCESATLLGQAGVQDKRLCPDTVRLGRDENLWNLDPNADLSDPAVLTDLSRRLPSVPQGPWERAPDTAVVFSLPNCAAEIVLGVSSRLELDDDYLDFLALVARHFGSAMEAEANQRQIEEERLRLKSVFMKSPAFMCILHGPTHVFDFVNEQYMRLVGEREILGKPVREALPEVGAQGFLNLLDEVLRTGEPYIGKNTEIFFQRTADAPLTKAIIDFVYQPIQEPSGAISGIFVHGIDITEEVEGEKEREHLLLSERAARSEAERSSRMKDEFLATLSHELRTPLNAILGWSSVLQSGKVTENDLQAGLETIERNARAQTQIIEDLLDMSRIISGKVRLDVRRIDLREVLRESMETVQAAADAKKILLWQSGESVTEPVNGDPNRLQQVFWNLLNNAIKFTERGGRVEVTLHRMDSHIEVRVIDTGQGIAAEFLPLVFDRFQQADSSSTRRHGGLGLGLAIVKQLVELHGGTVGAESAGAGLGATLIVRLPVMAPPTHDSDPEDEKYHRARKSLRDLGPLSLDGVRVLAVDDEPDARAFVKALLEGVQASVTTASNAREFFEIASDQSFDVLVCDVGMPGEDGHALMRRIRQTPGPNRDVPSMALTAFARPEDREKALRAGFQIHLPKPVEPAELITTVAQLASE